MKVDGLCEVWCQELGAVIKHCEWVEETEIGDWRLELGWDLAPVLYAPEDLGKLNLWLPNVGN